MTTLVPSFFDGSSSFLQITRTTIKARMSLNSGKIPSLTSELAALERPKINELCCDHSSSFIFDWIYFNLQATSKPIISWMCSKFNRIRPGAYELPALERLEKSP